MTLQNLQGAITDMGSTIVHFSRCFIKIARFHRILADRIGNWHVLCGSEFVLRGEKRDFGPTQSQLVDSLIFAKR
ncbi:MAG: hypothetical protein RLZZ245_3503 [Verrucomicrobiota bacterium]